MAEQLMIQLFILQTIDYLLVALEKVELEAIMDQISTRNQLIALNGNDDPQLIYLSHRKGWNCHDEELNDEQFIQKLIDKNCDFFVLHQPSRLSLSPTLQELPTVYQDPHFLIQMNTKLKIYRRFEIQLL